MALLDVSLITKAIIKLLELHIARSPAWTGANPPIVSPLPPDKLAANALGVYLYHLAEDSHYKNAVPTASDSPPIRYVPMGLNLFYQVSAGSSLNDDNDAYHAQLLLGCAVKALHDYPVLTDATEIDSVSIFDAVGLDQDGNTIRLTLQPVPPDQSISYWNSTNTPPRSAAYYQASVVMLEPDTPTQRSGRVLSRGVTSVLGGAPRLLVSDNVITFADPHTQQTREILAQPAQAPYGAEVTFRGVELTGQETQILLNNARWTRPRVVDAAWQAKVGPQRVSVVVQQTLEQEPLLPDIYSAVVGVVRIHTLPDGSTERFEHRSNEMPFTITPLVESLTGPDPSGLVTVIGYIFQHSDLAADSVQVYVGKDRLVLDNDGVLDAGEFQVVSPTEIRLRPPAEEDSLTTLPFRLFVNGAESPPQWMEV